MRKRKKYQGEVKINGQELSRHMITNDIVLNFWKSKMTENQESIREFPKQEMLEKKLLITFCEHTV